MYVSRFGPKQPYVFLVIFETVMWECLISRRKQGINLSMSVPETNLKMETGSVKKTEAEEDLNNNEDREEADDNYEYLDRVTHELQYKKNVD